MPRMAHHRVDNRTGPHHGWCQRKAYHLMKIFKLVHASIRMAASMRCVGPGHYYIPPADRLAWLDALDNAKPYATDETGDVWK